MNNYDLLLEKEIKLKESIKKNPNNIDLLNDYASVSVQLGNLDTALISYKNSLSLNSNQPIIYFYLGLILKEEEKFMDALNAFNYAIDCGLNIAELYFNRGNIFWGFNKKKEALEDFDKSISLDPYQSEYFYNRALILKDLGKLDSSLSSIKRAIEFDTNNDQNFFTCALILQDLHLYKDALKSINKAIQINPNNSENHYAKSCVLLDLDEYKESLNSINQAINLNSNIGSYYFIKSLIFKNMSLYKEAIFEIESAIKIEPNNAKFLWNHSVICLLNKDFEKAWINYDKRWLVEENKLKKIDINRPFWDGVKHTECLLIWAEQGIGDQILYLKFIVNAIKNTSNIIVLVDNRLVKLFNLSFPTIRFFSINEKKDNYQCDYQIPMADLAKIYLKNDLSLLQLESQYLKADPIESMQLKKFLKKRAGGKIICGISWNSNNNKTKKYKSIEFKNLLPILNLNNITFINIDCYQKKIKGHPNLTTLSNVDNFNNIYDLASLINACDIVITISNSTAHIAGALGKKTYLLLSKGKGELWYWFSKDMQSLWYPSIKIFQQIIPGSWDEPLSILFNELSLLT